MNWQRGLWRIWIIGAIAWLGYLSYNIYNRKIDYLDIIVLVDSNNEPGMRIKKYTDMSDFQKLIDNGGVETQYINEYPNATYYVLSHLSPTEKDIKYEIAKSFLRDAAFRERYLHWEMATKDFILWGLLPVGSSILVGYLLVWVVSGFREHS